MLAETGQFNGLSPEILAALDRAGRPHAYKRGDAIFWEGDTCTHLNLVCCGRVKVVRTLESGKEIIVDLIGPGFAVGEAALIDGFPYPFSAVAHDECDLFLVPRAPYLEICDAHPALFRKVAGDLSAHLRALNHRLFEFAGGAVEKRIAHVFLSLAERGSRLEGGAVEIGISLSRQEVAEMVGTTLESAIRVLSDWNKRDIVVKSGDGFRINVKALHGIRSRRRTHAV